MKEFKPEYNRMENPEGRRVYLEIRRINLEKTITGLKDLLEELENKKELKKYKHLSAILNLLQEKVLLEKQFEKFGNTLMGLESERSSGLLHDNMTYDKALELLKEENQKISEQLEQLE